MYPASDYRMSLCVLLVFVINLVNQLECRKTDLIADAAVGYPNSESNHNLRKPDATVADATQATNQQIPNNEQLRVLEQKLASLSPEARQAAVNSLKRYFLVYNLLKIRPFKRSLLNPVAYRPSARSPFSGTSQSLGSWSVSESNNEKSFFRPETAKRKFDLPRLAFTPGFLTKKAANSRQDNKVNEQGSNMTSFLNIVRDWKKEQPTCSQLKSLWETAISKLTDHFLNEPNDLYMQPHLNQMDNPIYLALLINLLKSDRNEPLKVFSFKEPPKASQLKASASNAAGHKNGPSDELLTKAAEQSKPLPMDYLMKMLNLNNRAPSEPYYFKNFKLLDQESAAKFDKFIPNPIDRQDHSLEIIEDGPTFIYNSDSNPAQFSAAQFWGDAQLSKPVNKPEARY